MHFNYIVLLTEYPYSLSLGLCFVKDKAFYEAILSRSNNSKGQFKSELSEVNLQSEFAVWINYISSCYDKNHDNNNEGEGKATGA